MLFVFRTASKTGPQKPTKLQKGAHNNLHLCIKRTTRDQGESILFLVDSIHPLALDSIEISFASSFSVQSANA